MERKERVIATCYFIKSPPFNPIGFLKTWNNRFFVLSEVESIGFGSDSVTIYQLKYYVSQKDFETGCLAKGSIDFGSIQRVSTCKDVLRTHRFTLCIETELRCYMLCTDNESHCNQWATLLREARFGIDKEGANEKATEERKHSFPKAVSKLRRVSVTTTDSGGSSSSSTGNSEEGRIEGFGAATNTTLVRTVAPRLQEPTGFSNRSKSELCRRPLPAIPHSDLKPRPWSMFETSSSRKPTVPSEALPSMIENRRERRNTERFFPCDAAIHESPPSDSHYISMKPTRDPMDSEYVAMCDFRHEYQIHSNLIKDQKSDKTDPQDIQEFRQPLIFDTVGNTEATRESGTIPHLPMDKSVEAAEKNSIYSSLQKALAETNTHCELVTDDKELQRTVSRALLTLPAELTVDGIGKWLDEVLSNNASFGESDDSRL